MTMKEVVAEAFFGGVPRSILYDNTKLAVAGGFKGMKLKCAYDEYLIERCEAIWDVAGKEHLDGVSGGVWTVNVGYGRERIANAIRDQLIQLPYFAGSAGSIPGARFAEKLIEKMPGMTRLYYTNSGSEANEYALMLAQHGAKVVVNDLGGARDVTGHSDMALQVVEEIEKMGGEAMSNGGSVTEYDQMEKMVADAKQKWGGVHVLINNAGILRDKTFAKMTLDDFRKVVEVHLMGSATCAHAVWPIMRDQKYGRIVFTTSASVCVSTAAVGSSSNRMGGSRSTARAMARRCCIPRLNVITTSRARRCKPTRRSSSSIRSRRDSGGADENVHADRADPGGRPGRGRGCAPHVDRCRETGPRPARRR